MGLDAVSPQCPSQLVVWKLPPRAAGSLAGSSALLPPPRCRRPHPERKQEPPAAVPGGLPHLWAETTRGEPCLPRPCQLRAEAGRPLETKLVPSAHQVIALALTG